MTVTARPKRRTLAHPTLHHRMSSLEERVSLLEARFGDIRDSIRGITECNMEIVSALVQLRDGAAQQEERIANAVTRAVLDELKALRREIRTRPCLIAARGGDECPVRED
jgi:hypothetical protein